MTNNLNEIVTKLVNGFNRKTNAYFMKGDFRSKYDSDDELKSEIASLGLDVTLVGQYGGEDMGSAYWSVYKFYLDNETVFVKFNGFYQSYNGAEFTEWFFVEPKEKVVIEYVPVK